MNEKILVTQSSMPSLDEYIEEIKPIFDSKWLTNMGPKHKELQAKLEEYLRVRHINLFTNGHMALYSAIKAMKLEGENIIPVEFTDGSYHNFTKSQKIVDGIYLIEAKGHTTGNSIVIVEDDDKYYMIHGDVTYTDEALYENKLSIIYEDIDLARQTLDNVREFISNNPTVYLSTHTPLGYENLENDAIVDLDNQPESIKPE